MSKFLDSDDEFGYDLSVDDEQALLQLSSNQPDPLHGASDLSTVIDSLPSRTDTISTGSIATSGTRQNAARARLPSDTALDQAEALPSPESLDEDVRYPDCVFTIGDFSILPFALTDSEAPSEPSAGESR